ncbi:hypothetical protein ACMYSQ_012446 [Aspergillus niger]
MPPQRRQRNRPDGAADETGALAPLRDWDWGKPTLEAGTRDTYVTLRWFDTAILVWDAGQNRQR